MKVNGLKVQDLMNSFTIRIDHQFDFDSSPSAEITEGAILHSTFSSETTWTWQNPLLDSFTEKVKTLGWHNGQHVEPVNSKYNFMLTQSTFKCGICSDQMSAECSFVSSESLIHFGSCERGIELKSRSQSASSGLQCWALWVNTTWTNVRVAR